MQLQEIIIKYPIYSFLICLIFSYPAWRFLRTVTQLLWEFNFYLLGLLIKKLMEQNTNDLVRNAKICKRTGMESQTLIDLILLIEDEISKLKKRMEDLEKSNES